MSLSIHFFIFLCLHISTAFQIRQETRARLITGAQKLEKACPTFLGLALASEMVGIESSYFGHYMIRVELQDHRNT